jgi:hypothetical protein
MRKKFLFICLSWLIALTANADNLYLYLQTCGLTADPNSSTPYATTDTSIEEGTEVTIRYTGTDNTTVLSIYINGEKVSSGKIKQKKNSPYTFTAKKNCILRVEGAYAFNFSTNPNVYFTQDVDVTVTANEGATGEYWATYYNSTESYTADANTTVYQAAVNSGKTAVVLTEVTGREIPAGKGVVLKSSAATITLTPTTTTTQTLEGNELTGVDAATAAPSNAYCLSKETTGSARGVGFYTYTGTIPAHRAYLVVAGGPSNARGFLGFGDDDNTTGISLPEAVVIENDGPIYDLSGRRIIGQPQKGIYVKNGKKVVIK